MTTGYSPFCGPLTPTFRKLLRRCGEPNLLHALNIILITFVRYIRAHDVSLTLGADELSINRQTPWFQCMAHDALS
jgi:hypothetical protein